MRRAWIPFENRRQAGVQLGAALARLQLRPPLIVLGLPRGGVPVAFEVARALRASLDVLVVRKVGSPGQPELALGALATGGVTVWQPRAGVFGPNVSEAEFGDRAAEERTELRRREHLYRAGRGPLDLTGQTAVLVDDGLATGATMLAAIRAARILNAASLIVAVPIASDEAAGLIRGACDQLVILHIPAYLVAVGEWYVDFTQLDDSEVCGLLAAAAVPVASAERTVRRSAM